MAPVRTGQRAAAGEHLIAPPGRARLSPEKVRAIRKTRRFPRPTQFDYVHLRRLVEDLRVALSEVEGPVREVVDVFCGTRPYEDLLPPGSHCIGLDIDDHYGTADVVSDEFLPFGDESFDLVLCTEAFHYAPEPGRAVAEIRRVLRPGGSAVISVPFAWEYDRTILEHRYTGPELTALFDGWCDVKVVENGGRVVTWATLTGSLLNAAEERLPKGLGIRGLLHPAWAAAYMVINGLGLLLDRFERRHAGSRTLPMNLLLTARRPPGG